MKKIISLVLVLVLALTAVGGTLAYFTDTDKETNTFTTGKVDIDLEENFEQNSKLMPGNKNAVPKEVWIELETGSEDAYVWYEWLIPADLDSTDGSTGTNNIIHVNSYGRTWDKYRENEAYWADGQTTALPKEQTWDHDPDEELDQVGPEGFIGTETIDGVEYNKYVVLYHGVLTAGQKTSVAMSQVYMDQGVDTNAAGEYIDKDGKVIDSDLIKDFSIIVRAYGIQAAGIADVYAAYTAYNAQ